MLTYLFYHPFTSMDILMVDTCMGTIIDFIGLNTIFISFLITGICFFLLVISRT